MHPLDGSIHRMLPFEKSLKTRSSNGWRNAMTFFLMSLNALTMLLCRKAREVFIHQLVWSTKRMQKRKRKCVMIYRLQIRVTDQLLLDAGTLEETSDPENRRFRIITPAPQTIYRQVIDYLTDVTKQEKVPPQTAVDFQEVTSATLAVCLRWGSYFAVLADKEVHEWTPLFQEEVPGIRDTEMARMNIEISSAFCQWLTLIHTDPKRFRKLVKAALKFLPPLPQIIFDKQSYQKELWLRTFFNSKAGRAEFMESLQNKVGEDFIVRKKEEITPHLMRILANGVINETYRYGPIENIHAGSYLPDSSVPSRISPCAEQEVLTTTAQRLLPTVHALYRIITKKTGETLEEKIIPYVFRFILTNLIFPSDWSLTEETRGIKLLVRK